MTMHRDVYQTPRCPSEECPGNTCRDGKHEQLSSLDGWWGRFFVVTMHLRRDEPPLVFMPFAGVALMVNSERRSSSAVPLNWFEACSTCGENDACDCEPNLLAILAHEEGGSEWQ